MLDFLLEEWRTFDYSLTETARHSGVAWSTLHDEDNPIVQELMQLDKKISEHFIQIELSEQEEIAEPVAVHAD